MELSHYSYTPTYSEVYYNNFIAAIDYLIEKRKKGNPLDSFSEELFKTFQVDIVRLFEYKHIFYQKLRIQPSEIENMMYYEFEFTVENLQKWVEEEKKQREKEEGDNKSIDQKSMMRDSQNMMKSQQAKMPSMATPKMSYLK